MSPIGATWVSKSSPLRRLRHNLGLGVLSVVFSSLLAGAVAAEVSTSRDPDTGLLSWNWTHDGILLRLAQLLPDQTRAFFVGRGFAEDVADRVARSCVLQTIFRNDGAQVVEYDLASWSILRSSERLRLRTREVWDREWQAQGIAESPRIAFRWSLLPTTQRYEPGDYNWGMTSFGLPPDAHFDLSLTVKVNGEPVSAVIPAIECAADR